MHVHAFAAQHPKSPLTPFEYEPGPLHEDDVEIRVSHCGICHSDIHLVDNDWGMSTYPLVPGHEVVGTIVKKGSAVTTLQEGQRVGLGWQAGSCGGCEFCRHAEENLCANQAATCVGRHGGFANSVRADSRFSIPIPEGLESENAAPLLCGGITVYTPLRAYDVRPPMALGVIGVGGLGHLAVQYASAWGCEVTAFSTSDNKREEAMALGADRFVNTSEAGSLARLTGHFDFLLSTVPADLDWGAYLGALRPKGKLCVVGVPQSEIHFQGFPLIAGQKSVCGSPIGSPAMIAEMLAFSARHGIAAKTERFPLERVNDALDRVRANGARYRVVLDVAGVA
ncbi:MAG TPA: NAD(P)-dependent alcohol dehydrogenase [Bryobacteraceae bacterium]|nr:NAD(P)-dependent alcohol dehydrogenase [Bryobacteraceae bacterium]